MELDTHLDLVKEIGEVSLFPMYDLYQEFFGVHWDSWLAIDLSCSI